jgi:protein HOOK3
VFRSPDYFDPTTIARHLGDNWALKSSNLRKLIRNLESYYHNELCKDFTDQLAHIDVSKIARESHPQSLLALSELVAAAAVTCPDKTIYIQRIMNMSGDAQMAMKGILEESLAKLTDHQNEKYPEDDDEEETENTLVFGESNLQEGEEEHSSSNALFGKHGKKSLTDTELEQQLQQLRTELASVKAQASEAAEESEKSQKKLQALVEDLQDRLMKRQDELIQVEEELQTATAELTDTKSRLAEIEELKNNLEDDLDVAKAKAEQLYKAEATVVAYKKKLEGVGIMSQQMEDLEGQAEKYLQQIMELEAEVKKSSALQKNVTSLEEKLAKLNKEKEDTLKTAQNLEKELGDVKARLSAAENAKKMYEQELTELRAKQQVFDAVESSMPNFQTNADGEKLTGEQREKMMRLEIENKQLRSQVDQLAKAAAAASTPIDGSEPIAIAVPAADDSPEVTALKVEIQRLMTAYTEKQKENAKIASDKDKLEAYTKRTLAKFQDKYLVALQECKAKLKEKQDKIDLLEKRSASERTAQKREERLLSSTIYELGLGIMQNKIKASATAAGT